MNQRLHVILIEDDADTCERFAKYTETNNDIVLLSVTNNSYRALELVNEYLPDAIILDLELNEGKGNGILFLQGLNNLSLAFKPFILITTNNSSSTMYEYTRQLGADFIMSKHQADYSEQKAVDFLTTMKDIIKNTKKNQCPEHITVVSPYEHKKRLTRMIMLELDNIGISSKMIGYKYLTDAILYVIDNQNTNLCFNIGQKYNKTASSVERAMQNAINKAWQTNDIDELLRHYTAKINSEKGVPTLTEFIYHYAAKIKNNC